MEVPDDHQEHAGTLHAGPGNRYERVDVADGHGNRVLQAEAVRHFGSQCPGAVPGGAKLVPSFSVGSEKPG